MGVILYSTISDVVLPLHKAGYLSGNRNMSLCEVTSDLVLRQEMLDRSNRCLFVQAEASTELLDLIVRLAGRKSNGEYAVIVLSPQKGVFDLTAYCLNMGIRMFNADQITDAIAWASGKS